MKRTTLVIYRKSQWKIITRFPAHMISVDDAGRVSGRDNMYLVLAQESNPDALDAWKRGAKSASAAKRRNLAAELEPRGLVIARMGDNGDAVVMWDDEFAMSEHNLAYAAKLAAERKAHEEKEARTVRINLVTRGWGDYGMAAWCGDITRPTAEIVAECRAQLEHDTAKDYGMSDEEITKEVEKAKAAWVAKNTKREAAATPKDTTVQGEGIGIFYRNPLTLGAKQEMKVGDRVRAKGALGEYIIIGADGKGNITLMDADPDGTASFVTDGSDLVCIQPTTVDPAKNPIMGKNADAHIEDCKRRAHETGERVEIRHYATECHDQHEECSLDIVTEWAMPDGTITKSYQHTW